MSSAPASPPAPAASQFPLVATAGKEVRNKNLIFIALCAVFTLWFGYDGLVAYPAHNDDAITQINNNDKDKAKRDAASPDVRTLIEKWPKWANASPEDREKATKFVRDQNFIYKWHSPTDITVQLVITAGLVLVTAGAIWNYTRCQKRRAWADETTLSPSPGVSFPWTAITKVDNTRWKKSGIVYVTYKDASGAKNEAVLDDYHLDNLRPILHELATRAVNAEFEPKDDVGASETTGTSNSPEA